jgi:hypothetical protein
MDDKELDKLFQADMDSSPEVTLDSLGELAELAKLQINYEHQVSEIEGLLSGLKEKLRQVQEIDIPTMMLGMGMKAFKLESGASITIKQDIFASIRAEKVEAALEFFDKELGLGSLIKDDVAVKFGKGDEKKAKTLTEFCREAGFNFTEKKYIHPQTLKAEIKRQMETGREFPEELFSIHPFNKAVIKTK